MKELEYPFESNFILRKKKTLKRQLIQDGQLRTKVRIAILGGSTTADIASVLELFLLNIGIEPQIYESEYNHYWEDAVFGNSELDSFRPEIVFIHTSFRNISNFPAVGDSEEEVSRKLEKEYQRLEAAWNALVEKYHCIIIQNNYERPLLGTLGNQDIADFRGYANYVNRLNTRIYQYKKENKRFYIHDVEGLAAEYGLRKWQDFRTWYLYKYSMTMEAIPEFAYHLSVIIGSIYGKSKKILVLDADNTLWNGVIGECGADGIDIGNETSKGQSYLEWQSYIRRLKEQGVLLAIASKNEEAAVEEGLSHPDSLLKKDDFSATAINWGDKATNLTLLSRQLNIGTGFMVFADDNPAERELIRQKLPEVCVLDADCPERFLSLLSSAHLFETVDISDEDVKRTEMYAANQKREADKDKFSDYQEYLKSLEMEAEIAEFQPLHYSRIAQLTNKTNQFNLTTWRMTENDIIKCAEDSNWICLYGRLKDRFGDNGIVSILIAEKVGNEVYIRNMILSCRVFKRQMEYAMIDTLMCRCKAQNVGRIIGYYYPTQKNKPAENFYQEVGFEQISKEDSGASVWSIKVSEYQKKNEVIFVEENNGENTSIE